MAALQCQRFQLARWALMFCGQSCACYIPQNDSQTFDERCTTALSQFMCHAAKQCCKASNSQTLEDTSSSRPQTRPHRVQVKGHLHAVRLWLTKLCHWHKAFVEHPRGETKEHSALPAGVSDEASTPMHQNKLSVLYIPKRILPTDVPGFPLKTSNSQTNSSTCRTPLMHQTDTCMKIWPSIAFTLLINNCD